MTRGVAPSISMPVERSITSSPIDAIDEQIIFLARAQLGTDIACSRVAVFTPPKNGVNESSDVTGASEAATSAPNTGATTSTLRDREWCCYFHLIISSFWRISSTVIAG